METPLLESTVPTSVKVFIITTELSLWVQYSSIVQYSTV